MSTSNLTTASAPTPSWFHLLPTTPFLDNGSPINLTGLNLFTESTEIDDGSYLQVTPSSSPDPDPQSATPFYIDDTTGHLMGQQSVWGLETIYTWNDDYQGSVWGWSADGTPDVLRYAYPEFEGDGEGGLRVKGQENLQWGWCPDEEGVGDGERYLPGTVVLTGERERVEGLECVVFEELRVVASEPPGRRR